MTITVENCLHFNISSPKHSAAEHFIIHSPIPVVDDELSESRVPESITFSTTCPSVNQAMDEHHELLDEQCLTLQNESHSDAQALEPQNDVLMDILQESNRQVD